MRLLSTILFVVFSIASVAQANNEIKARVDKLNFITDVPYTCEAEIGKEGCGDTIFWNIVKLKEKAIPWLIDKMGDASLTKVTVPNFGGNYATGDIAYTVLQEIINGIPTFELLGVAFDKDGCGYCSYWNYLRKNKNNRKLFMQAVSKWYMANKSKLVWIQSNKVLTCDCGFGHPNGGHYTVRK